jgi:hypothetical protein
MLQPSPRAYSRCQSRLHTLLLHRVTASCFTISRYALSYACPLLPPFPVLAGAAPSRRFARGLPCSSSPRVRTRDPEAPESLPESPAVRRQCLSAGDQCLWLHAADAATEVMSPVSSWGGSMLDSMFEDAVEGMGTDAIAAAVAGICEQHLSLLTYRRPPMHASRWHMMLVESWWMRSHVSL